jgi:hypothetical protein
VNEFEVEPLPGLPERLPPGERILWQGTPGWRNLARRAFHVRKVALYFAVVLTWIAVGDLMAGEPWVNAALGGGWVLVLAHLSIALLLLLAWAMGRATIYTITNRRVVMRFGVAIPMTINIPFRQIVTASLRAYRDGSGDIPLTLAPGRRVSYMVLWPHVRPWHLVQAQPMLRAVPEAQRVARILREAVAESAEVVPGGEAANDPGEAELRRAAVAHSA